MMQKLEAQHVCYKKENPILSDFSFTFEKPLYGIISNRNEENSNILKILAGLLNPDSGSVLLDGRNVFTSFQKKERVIRKQIGFVFQSGGLLSNLNVLENLLVPYDFHFPDVSREEKLEKILIYLNGFGLSESILSERPAKLTISVRKALLFIRTYIVDPKIIFYDDPLMNCSQQVQRSIFEMILKLKEEKTIQIFCETVDAQMYKLADEVILFNEGEIYSSSSFSELKNSNSDYVTSLILKLFAE
jgi:ABC-type transporter Mla maintaining outer membrane lipid asymmetry ATPase subunit MlaF